MLLVNPCMLLGRGKRHVCSKMGGIDMKIFYCNYNDGNEGRLHKGHCAVHKLTLSVCYA